LVIYTYKIALDPFLVILLASKDRGIYQFYAPVVLIIICMGFVVHVGWLLTKIYDLKREKVKNKETTNQKLKSIILIPIIFFLVIVAGQVIKSGVMKDMELAFILAIATIVFIAMLIGAVEYLLALFCIFLFPSFSVNQPSKKQYGNKKKKGKKNK